MLRFPFDNNWLETIMGRMLLLLLLLLEGLHRNCKANMWIRIIVACHIIINKTATWQLIKVFQLQIIAEQNFNSVTSFIPPFMACVMEINSIVLLTSFTILTHIYRHIREKKAKFNCILYSYLSWNIRFFHTQKIDLNEKSKKKKKVKPH